MKKLKKDYTTIECNHNNNYKLTAELLEDSLEKNNGHNSLLFLNSPTNPTGAVYTEEEYISLIKIFDKYNITVFSDEIYFNTSQIKTISLSNLYNNCILGSSLSKDWASGGWRFGWMVFSDSLKDLHADMVSCGSIMYSCPTDFFNNVGAEALINSENEQYFNKQRIFFQKISDNIDNELLKPNKLIISNYQGAWYKWVDLKNYSNELKLLNHADAINNSEELANVLANEIGLIVVAGKFFGIEGATFRLSMVDENIHIGIRELIKWLNV
jgi:aspartate aminotransferase